MSIPEELIKLDSKCSKYGPALFYWQHNQELHGITCTHFDHFHFGVTNEFMSNGISLIKAKFVIGSECHTAFKYIGLSVNQLRDHSIVVDQERYIDSNQEMQSSRERRGEKDSHVNDQS